MIAGEDESAEVGVGPWEGEKPTDSRYDPELLAQGDRRTPQARTPVSDPRYVATSPARSSTPTCFFMPVMVIWKRSAKSVIEASERPSCSSTPRRVASERAAKEASSLAGEH